MTKARPILMSAPMVQALLREIEQEGTGKTQTRRIAKIPACFDDWKGAVNTHNGILTFYDKEDAKGTCESFFCPHGTVGDVLWVREKCSVAISGKLTNLPWFEHQTYDSHGNPSFDGEGELVYEADGIEYEKLPSSKSARLKGGWRPSIHMPRFASRITLEITDIRVERLQDISEEDAKAEGVSAYKDVCANSRKPFQVSAKQAFYNMWIGIHGYDKILHGNCSLEANPFVWVIEFKPHLVNVDALLQQMEVK